MWALICHHLGTRRGTHHHRDRQSKKMERSGSWWHHRRQHQSAPQPPPPTPRDLGDVRQCVLPATMPGFPVLEAENIVTTPEVQVQMQSHQRSTFCQLIEYTSKSQNVSVQHGFCCFTNKCNQGKGYFIFAICKCIATCFKLSASLKLANCWPLSKKLYEGLSSSLRPVSLFLKIISVYFIDTFIEWHCGCGSVADPCVFPVKEDVCDG